ncbi:hypothetical protein CapIbe_008397 [Capra ibex]
MDRKNTKPLASARAREANRSASAAEPLVEVWPISHTFGVLIRRGWDFGKCAVDLAESDEERKRSEKPESPLVKYVRPQRPALFQHLTLNSDIQEGTKLESYHGRQRICLGKSRVMSESPHGLRWRTTFTARSVDFILSMEIPFGGLSLLIQHILWL